MKKVILLIALAVGVTAGAAAQDSKVKFGVRAGLNFANVGGDADGADARVGFHVGGVADIQFHEYFYFQPGLMITTKGYKTSKGEWDTKARPTYLELPLMLSFGYPINSDLKIRANVGPYLAMGLLGKIKTDDDSDDYFGDEGIAKRFDFGLGFGAGVDFKQYYIGIAYDLGLINTWDLTSPAGDELKVTNGAFMITLGYNF